MKVKEESEKVGLKLNIQKTKITASSAITSWQIDGETMETVRDFLGGAPKSLHVSVSQGLLFRVQNLILGPESALFLQIPHSYNAPALSAPFIPW